MTGKKIAVLATGGTLAGKAASAHDNVGYTAAQVGVDELLASIPALQGFSLVTEQVAQVDSKDMTFDIWRKLAVRCAHWLAQDDIRGVVITHGTDTLEETAFFLHCVLAPVKPVVLTCAMRPATALVPDGPQNIVDAMSVALAEGARGVVAVCAGTIHGAVDVAKQHTYRLDAFTSGDAGAVGYVEERQLRLLRDWPAADAGATAVMQKVISAGRWPRVEIVMNHAGAGGAMVEALVAQGVDGLVVAGTGNGTVSADLMAALQAAAAKGVRVVRATRCAEGQVIAHAGDRLPASAVAPVKARVELMLSLLA
ncbi:asparaginase [Ramlibacter sp. WS9]|uniref:asparaginase n=1 Tax=Ramlibacter sp. WS9 TaxID=1882741 RepID=UPI0011430C84|nr:asparaginase [Ramlibacter sp. WS9]ROZ77146.1 asparaginase [Ramlibacter sp. WS9]